MLNLPKTIDDKITMKITFFLTLIIVTFGSLLPENFRCFSQAAKKAITLEAVGLRDSPNLSVSFSVILPKNKILYASPVSIKGWYFITTASRPFLSGYVYGNSIRFVEEKTIPKAIPKSKAQSTPKNSKIIIPKGSTDTDAPVYDVEIGEDSIKSEKRKSKSIQPPKPSFVNLCKGNLYCPDIEEVVSVLISENERFTKGKFEKSEEYSKRLDKVLSEFKLTNSHTFADEMTIIYIPEYNSYEQKILSYDADSELWSFAVETKKVEEDTCIPITSHLLGSKYCLTVNTDFELSNPLYINVPMSPKEAAENDNKLFIAFVVNMKISNYAKLPSATPRVNTARISSVEFKVKEVICVNPSTGKKWQVIIKKI